VSGKQESWVLTSPTAGIQGCDIPLWQQREAGATSEEVVVKFIPAANVSARVEELIDQHDGGDRLTAARRLGLDPDHLTGLLSGDWRRFSLDALAALLRGYSVSLDSLLASPTGRSAVGPSSPTMEMEARPWQ
jgi:hypothetical protein